MKQPAPLLAVRLQANNRLTFPAVLRTLECAGLTRHFEPRLVQNQPDLHRMLKLRRPCLLLYSFMTTQLPQIQRELRWINLHRHGNLLLVAGGPHTTGDAVSALKLGFDVAFTGAAEMGLCHLVENYLNGALPETPLVYRAGDLDHLDRSLPLSRILPVSPPLEITRGCFWNCRFCQTACQKTRHRSLESFFRYYEQLRQRGHHRRVSFISPSAFEYGAADANQPNPAAIGRLLEFCRVNGTQLLEYGIFPSETRPNTFSEELVSLVTRYCTNRKITIGAQSGSERLLKYLRRGHTVADTETACQIAVRHKLRPLVDIILGFPGENSTDRSETLQFIRRLSVAYRARIHLHYFLPLSGTDLADAMPAPLDYRTIDMIGKLERAGIATHWWKKGLALARQLILIRDQLKAQSIEYREMEAPVPPENNFPKRSQG